MITSHTLPHLGDVPAPAGGWGYRITAYIKQSLGWTLVNGADAPSASP